MGPRTTRSATAAKNHQNQSDAATRKTSTASKVPANVGIKRKRPSIKEEPVDNEQSTPKTKSARTKSKDAKAAKKTAASKPEPDLEAGAEVAAKLLGSTVTSPSKDKANSYNLTPGVSPYPFYDRPTPEECQNVYELLAAVHGDISAPKTVPAPNLKSSGCGEVPSVLDALVRTRLSAATNNQNSGRAFRGLVEKFGVIEEGIGKGSVDWNKVRLADVKEVFEAIKTGGLADVKSRDIQKILQMVYEENEQSADAKKENKVVLSLDHLHEMSSEDAFAKLIGYPGVGPKTASCVLLFCMQRPSFAVDTHVFRLVSWLGWVPNEAAVRRMAKEVKVKDEDGGDASGPSKKKAKAPPPASRNTAYAHLDVRIPDHLKYPLHYLFIRHGRTCPSCAAKKDHKIREEWGDKKCPLAALKNGNKVSVGKKIVKEEEGYIKSEPDDEAHISDEEDEDE